MVTVYADGNTLILAEVDIFVFFLYFSSKPKSSQGAMDLSVALKDGNIKNSNKKKKRKKNKTGNRTSQTSS